MNIIKKKDKFHENIIIKSGNQNKALKDIDSFKDFFYHPKLKLKSIITK